MKKVVCVAGTRPEAIKMAPVIEAFLDMSEVDLKFIWSGQHYDYMMSEVFFEELNLPKPDVNLDVRSGSHAEQTAKIMLGLDKLFKEDRPDIVLAEGDTNTVLATGLTAIKEHIPFGHVEAGLRSYDRVMPEEINRCVAGVCAELNFAPTPNSAINLLYEGVPPSRIFITGNTIVDVIKKVINDRDRDKIADKFHLDQGLAKVLLTLHRAENVDSQARLSEIVSALKSLSSNVRIIFPVHPRTMKRLKEFRLLDELIECQNILLSGPLGYVEFLNLLSMMDLVLTDSGGVQEEAMVLHVPTITLRYNTERPETVWYGWNILAGVEKDEILRLVKLLLNKKGFRKGTHLTHIQIFREEKELDNHAKNNTSDFANLLGDGYAGKRIAGIVVNQIDRGLEMVSPKFLRTGSATHFIIPVTKKVKVSQINESGEAFVTLVYDEHGSPIFPYPELYLKPGYYVRLFGPTIPSCAFR